MFLSVRVLGCFVAQDLDDTFLPHAGCPERSSGINLIAVTLVRTLVDFDVDVLSHTNQTSRLRVGECLTITTGAGCASRPDELEAHERIDLTIHKGTDAVVIGAGDFRSAKQRLLLRRMSEQRNRLAVINGVIAFQQIERTAKFADGEVAVCSTATLNIVHRDAIGGVVSLSANAILASVSSAKQPSDDGVVHLATKSASLRFSITRLRIDNHPQPVLGVEKLVTVIANHLIPATGLIDGVVGRVAVARGDRVYGCRAQTIPIIVFGVLGDFAEGSTELATFLLKDMLKLAVIRIYKCCINRIRHNCKYFKPC